MMWWIDRWRKSTAFVDLNAEAQGAYRNLIDEAWLRGGVIPNDPRMIARVSCADNWPEIQSVVMARFYAADGGWRNLTVDTLIRKSERYADKQRAYRERQKAENPPAQKLDYGVPRSDNAKPRSGNKAVTKAVTRKVTKGVTRRVTK